MTWEKLCEIHNVVSEVEVAYEYLRDTKEGE